MVEFTTLIVTFNERENIGRTLSFGYAGCAIEFSRPIAPKDCLGCAADVFLSDFCTGAAPRWLAGMVLCVPTHHRQIVIVGPATD
jgi:hypothetical protein